MAYSYGQLESLWVKAGGSRALAPLMAAIAMAESAGNPAANNYDDNGGRQTSWGLWQVSDGTHNWPGQQDPNVPINNARYAVAKYQAQGLGAWGTYDSGAYKQYYQGSTPPSSLPQGGGGGQQASTAAWWDPSSIVGGIESLWKNAGNVANAGDALGQIAQGFTTLLKAFEWLFVPSHWVRIFAFFFGLLFLIPGLYAMMRASQGGQGDITLALAILFIVLAGILLFIAFHNLPQDVGNLQELLAWLSDSIRQGKAAQTTAPGVIPDNGLGGRVAQTAGGAV